MKEILLAVFLCLTVADETVDDIPQITVREKSPIIPTVYRQIVVSPDLKGLSKEELIKVLKRTAISI